jgi:hypothetical protein
MYGFVRASSRTESVLRAPACGGSQVSSAGISRLQTVFVPDFGYVKRKIFAAFRTKGH